MKSLLWRICGAVEYRLAGIKTAIYYRLFFGRIGSKSRLIAPINISNPDRIYLGSNVLIRTGARFEVVVSRYGDAFNPKIEIGDGTIIEQYFHVACASHVKIGRNVSITQRVGIFDIWHSYNDPTLAIAEQVLRTLPVSIGDDCFIGMGAVIQPGVNIGRHCIIGANSVVTKNIPDYSVAVGLPARVIRTFDPVSNTWQNNS